MKKYRSSLRFLIIEDVKEHAALIKEAVHTHDFLHDISSVKNCDMAIQLLNEYQKQQERLDHQDTLMDDLLIRLALVEELLAQE